jgi:hypothetical protein
MKFENNKINSFNEVIVITSKFLKVYMKIRWYSSRYGLHGQPMPTDAQSDPFAHGLVSDFYIHMQIVLPR